MEDEHKFDLSFAGSEIRNWKKWYFKKNTKNPTAIKLRVLFEGPEIFWRYYLELHIKRQIKSKIRITPEAYDTLSRDPKLERSHYQGIEFVTLLKIN